MKISEYIEDIQYLNKTNCIQLFKYEKLFEEFVSYDSKYIILDITEDFLHNSKIEDILNPLNNKIVFLHNPDIDFPPPKQQYEYDKYFNTSNLPSNYETIDYYDKIDKDIIQILENNNLHIISFAVSINHPRVTFIPLGTYTYFNHFHLKQSSKDILCYLNMGIHCDRWFGNPRKVVVDILENKDFIHKRHGLSFDDFYNDISRSKFMICPRGCGIDTYRLWDCIALGCIPIVEKYESHENWNDLPILFLDNIKDFELLTEDFLNTKYEEFLQKDFNYDKCKIEYWQNIIYNKKDIFSK